MPNYTAPRGTQDVLPEDQPYWRHVVRRAHHIAALYGFQQIDVPMFEETSLFVRGVGEGTDIVDKEMYSFEDKGGSEITLRPEFTAGLVRAYIEHGMHALPQPVKLYAIGPIFRYERPQAGRYRQHTQFNIEAFGEVDPALDAEIMEVARHLCADLGFGGLSFQVNSTGCPKCRPQYVSRLVDYYHQHEDAICEDCERRLVRNPLRVLDCKVATCQPIIAGAPHIVDDLCEECAAHFRELQQYLRALRRTYTINHRLVRGLDYYQKTVFEVWSQDIGAQAAVFGGGRYDGLAELLGGPPTPGIGFGSGIERLILAMQAQEIEVPPLPKPRVLVATLGDEAKRVGVKLLSDMRMADVGAVIAFGGRSLRSQLREAGKQEVCYVVMIGQDELRDQVVTVRDMSTRDQYTVPTDELVAWLTERLAG
ncbi:MAG TPA: histidine--tRNA ligase [Anaerolineae bacterium]|nr:histidine--tRNA ligase [Anaerolineae bacterium]